MKFSLLFFAGLFIMLSLVILTTNTNEFQIFNFNQVFAQSEGKNKNFEDASASQSSETSTKIKHKNNDSNGKLFDNQIVTHSSDTSTMGNKNKDKTFSMGRFSGNENYKIHPAISKILEHANPKAMAKIYGASVEDDNLYVYVHFKGNKIQTIPNHVDILAQDKNIIVSKLSLNQIKSISNLSFVEKITLPDYAVFDTHDVSEGVSLSMADSMHSSGFTGTGINVAVIDDSFITTNSEISGNIVNEWFGPGCTNMACNKTDGKSHGTAVAEIVVDMAPDVNLWLYTIQTSVDFANAVDDAMANNVDIITASLGFPTQGGNDNSTGWYRDGTSEAAQKVNEAKSNGILFTLAAGNQGEGHWSGNYTDPIMAISTAGINQTGNLKGDLDNFAGEGGEYDSLLVFNNTAPGDMRVCLPVTNFGTSNFMVTWNAWPTTIDQDYDVMLYSPDMQVFWNGSFLVQNNPMLPNRPFESFSHANDLGDACLVIASFESSENHRFHIDVGNNEIDESFMVPSGSIDTPADATGALAVGAVNFNKSPVNYSDDFLEAFSSQGPTDDNRLKPEICGPDGTLTHQNSLSTSSPKFFSGTSASAPHVAGAAALLLDENPSLTANQLKDELINNARDIPSFSQNNLCGGNSGVVFVGDPNTCPPIPVWGTWHITNSCTLDENTILPGNLFVQNESVLTIPNGITLSMDFTNFNLTVEFESGILVESGGTIDTGAVMNSDGDGILDGNDNCKFISNVSQIDTDSDFLGNACDTDDDDDTILDGADNCPLIINFNQLDTDMDGMGNACDSDDDDDTILDVNDNCSLVSNVSQLDTDMDGMGNACDTDDDNDEVSDGADNCSLTPNTNQIDLDSDGTGDVCDSQTTITTNTTLADDTLLLGDLTIESGVVLTIDPGVTMDMDLVNNKILVKFGGGILVKSGGTIT